MDQDRIPQIILALVGIGVSLWVLPYLLRETRASFRDTQQAWRHLVATVKQIRAGRFDG